MMPANTQLIIALIVSSVCFITDIKKAKIYNTVTFPGMLAGLIAAFFLFGTEGLQNSLCGLLLGIIIYLPFAVFGIVGMGDVKLLASIGAVCGTYFVLKTFIISSAIGFFHAIAVQFANYGINGLGLLLISLKEKIFLKKNIKKESEYLEKKNKHKFLIGIDIFLATLILSYLYAFTSFSKT